MAKYRNVSKFSDIEAVKWDGTNLNELVEFCGEDRIDVKNSKIPQIRTYPNKRTWVMLNTNEYIIKANGVLSCVNGNDFENDYTLIENISDGYHTFNELYEYRLLYNAALFNELNQRHDFCICKSKKHSDGKDCFSGDWFIVVAELPTGQISNHYEMKYWNLFKIPEVEIAPKWDGHTSKEAAERLRSFIETM